MCPSVSILNQYELREIYKHIINTNVVTDLCVLLLIYFYYNISYNYILFKN